MYSVPNLLSADHSPHLDERDGFVRFCSVLFLFDLDERDDGLVMCCSVLLFFLWFCSHLDERDGLLVGRVEADERLRRGGRWRRVGAAAAVATLL